MREGERQNERVCATDVTVRRCIDVMYLYAESETNICVIIFVTPSPLPLHVFVKHLELLRIGV